MNTRNGVLGTSAFLLGICAVIQMPFRFEKSVAETITNPAFDVRQQINNLTPAHRATFGGPAWIAKFDGSLASKTPVWVSQFGGTANFPFVRGCTTDRKGNVFIAGEDSGSFAGSNKGENDAWLAKLRPNGRLLWKKRLGTPADDEALGVATDRRGNVILTGRSEGNIAGKNKGREDIFIAKYDAQGSLVWKKQLGTASSDIGYGVATDARGNILITGLGLTLNGTGFYAAKFSPAGRLLWITRLGGVGRGTAYGVATDPIGNVILTGVYLGDLGGPSKGGDDAWVAKLNANGKLTWLRQLGSSSSENARGVATDSRGNIFISGATRGNLGSANRGVEDAWIAKYTPVGRLSWVKQIGTPNLDRSYGVAIDGNGNALIAGETYGSLGGPLLGLVDSWVAKYRSRGSLSRRRQIGSGLTTAAYCVATDGNGDVLMGGLTAGPISTP